jgi:hypothetical protein
MIQNETSSATGRGKDADGYKLNGCGRVKPSFLNTEKNITNVLQQVSDLMTNTSGTFFTSFKSIHTSCKSSVKILK